MCGHKQNMSVRVKEIGFDFLLLLFFCFKVLNSGGDSVCVIKLCWLGVFLSLIKCDFFVFVQLWLKLVFAS